MARRTSWRYLSGYSEAKRQMKRGSSTPRKTVQGGGFSIFYHWHYVLLAIALICLILTVVYVSFLTNPLATGIVLGGIFAPLTLWLVASRFYRERQKKQKLIRTEEERKSKKSRLMNKYGDEELVTQIMEQHAWTGQTAGMLKDSLGPPEAVDVVALKTKKKEIWKYFHKGGNRYGARITLDNDVVVKMDVKDEHIGDITYTEI